MSQNPYSTPGTSSQPKVPRRKRSLERTKSSSRGSQGQRTLQGAADIWWHCVWLPVHLLCCCGVRQGISPCRNGIVGQHKHCQAKISFLPPKNGMEENLAAGKVRVSPKGGSLPGSACSSVESKNWVQASQFARVHRITQVGKNLQGWVQPVANPCPVNWTGALSATSICFLNTSTPPQEAQTFQPFSSLGWKLTLTLLLGVLFLQPITWVLLAPELEAVFWCYIWKFEGGNYLAYKMPPHL